MQTLAIIAAWGCLGAIIFVTMSPPGLRPQLGDARVERGTAFAALGLLFGLAYADWIWAVAVGAVLSAPVLELAQRLVAGRHGELPDALQKMVGAAAGVGIAWIIGQLI